MEGPRGLGKLAVALLGLALLPILTPAAGGDWPDWPLRRKAAVGQPNTLEQIARSVDAIEKDVLDDGTVVIKRPDVYSQSRMTLYRKNFEAALFNAVNQFNVVLSARVFRSDQAAFLSQSNLAAAAGQAKAGSGGSTRGATSSSSNTTVQAPSLVPLNNATGVTPEGLASNSIVRPNSLTALANPSAGGAPFSLGFAGAPGTTQNPYGLGIEPTVYLDELKRYQDHLNQIRRVNMGDDIADSAGYGLYLVRMPVSLQPGECTRKGHGAVLTATLRHDFGPDFLRDTYRNLVINDLVDQLSPVIYEILRSDLIKRLPDDAQTRKNAIEKYSANTERILQLRAILADPQSKAADSETKARQIDRGSPLKASFNRTISISGSFTRLNDRGYPVSGTEFGDVFIEQNILMMSLYANEAMQAVVPKANDVRAFLRREIEASYDVIAQIYGANDPGSESIVETYENKVADIARHIRTRRYQDRKARIDQRVDIENDYRDIARVMPGNLQYEERLKKDDVRYVRDVNSSLVMMRVIMCYAIAVEAGLLNDQLVVDMKRVFGKDAVDGAELDAMRFFSPRPTPEAKAKFEEYVQKRWPIITFALDPMVDEQNIADASSVKRDLQLALAFAFSTGQINFNQLTQYQRRIEMDSEAIALNRTATSFAHGNNTFGFRFYPRYQNPPLEKSNFQAITNQLLKGGPGRNYQTNNSKLEAGQRELSAIVVMPSFLQGIQMDVTGNWFRLVDPDRMKTPTPRMIEQGRRVVELREALNCIHDHKTYRAGDIQRLKTRIDQIEAMLPMQTQDVGVPYENTLGGFQLFQQGVTSLVPQLDGFEGAGAINKASIGTDLFLFGKHFSVQETNVVVGGILLSRNSLLVRGSNQSTQPIPATATNATVVDPNNNGTNPSGSPFVFNGPSTSTANNPAIDIVSREVMRICIPTGVQTTEVLDADGQGKKTYVEVYVATPTGISNKLLVPYAEPDAKPTVAYTIDTKSASLTVNYMLEPAGDHMRPVRGVPAPNSDLTINWASPLGAAPRTVQVSIAFTYKNNAKLTLPLPSPIVKGSGGKYKLAPGDLEALARQFIAAIARIDNTISVDKPIGPVTVDAVSITPDDPAFDAQAVKANGTFKITPALVGSGVSMMRRLDPAVLRASYTAPIASPTAARLPAPVRIPPPRVSPGASISSTEPLPPLPAGLRPVQPLRPARKEASASRGLSRSRSDGSSRQGGRAVRDFK
jgi:hypothetical protein